MTPQEQEARDLHDHLAEIMSDLGGMLNLDLPASCYDSLNTAFNEVAKAKRQVASGFPSVEV